MAASSQRRDVSLLSIPALAIAAPQPSQRRSTSRCSNVRPRAIAARSVRRSILSSPASALGQTRVHSPQAVHRDGSKASETSSLHWSRHSAPPWGTRPAPAAYLFIQRHHSQGRGLMIQSDRSPCTVRQAVLSPQQQPPYRKCGPAPPLDPTDDPARVEPLHRWSGPSSVTLATSLAWNLKIT